MAVRLNVSRMELAKGRGGLAITPNIVVGGGAVGF
jgi:hypothetical protein